MHGRASSALYDGGSYREKSGEKGYVQAKRYGNTYVYSPSIDEGEYKTKFLSGVVQNYFENSYKEMVTFFARKQKISAKELEEIIRLIEKE